MPTDRWIRENALWSPPPGWTPLEGTPPAPAEWRFWKPNGLWPVLTSAYYRPFAMWRWIGNALLLAWLLSVLIGFATQFPAPVRVIAVVALLGSAICGVVYTIRAGRMTDALLDGFAIAAAGERSKRLTREYQRYLRDVA